MNTQTIERKVGMTGNRSFEVTRISDNTPGMTKERLRDILIKNSLPNTGIREVDRYRLRNLPNLLRGLPSIYVAKRVKAPTFFGVVSAKVTRASGEELDLGVVSCRVVTTAGVGFIVDAFQNLVEAEAMRFHGFGTGGTAEAVGDTALVTELTTQYAVDNTRPTGSQTEGAANVYRTVGTLSPDATVAITEHGIFSAAAAGVLLDRSVFAAVNLVSGDSLQITYDATFSAGG